MHTTDNSVILETTHRTHGLLESGGVIGRLVAYPRADVAKLLGIDDAELPNYDETTLPNGYTITARELISHHLRGRVLRRGERIA